MWKRRSIMAAILLGAATVGGGVAAGGEIEGAIEGINPQSQELLLLDGTTLAVKDATQITIDGQRGWFKNLKAGDEVRAIYEEHGTQRPATAIAVRKRSL
jgi:hypothetical protein